MRFTGTVSLSTKRRPTVATSSRLRSRITRAVSSAACLIRSRKLAICTLTLTSNDIGQISLDRDAPITLQQVVDGGAGGGRRGAAGARRATARGHVAGREIHDSRILMGDHTNAGAAGSFLRGLRSELPHHHSGRLLEIR